MAVSYMQIRSDWIPTFPGPEEHAHVVAFGTDIAEVS